MPDDDDHTFDALLSDPMEGDYGARVTAFKTALTATFERLWLRPDGPDLMDDFLADRLHFVVALRGVTMIGYEDEPPAV